jgi:DNA polymerase I
MADEVLFDPLLFGKNPEERLVAIEHVEGDEQDKMVLFFRDGDETIQKNEPFKPFIVADINAIGECPQEYESTALKGAGELNLLASFSTWKDFKEARSWLGKKTRMSASVPSAPYFCFSDPVQQHLVTTGRTLFLGMGLEDVRRMQVDIECITTEGYDFCNADRAGDRIVAIALTDQTGWVEVLSGLELTEKELLARFVEIVRDRDPDVLEGHNIFNFDLAYIAKRAKRHKVKLELGRDGSVPTSRASRHSIGERTISYTRCDIYGRHVLDTLFLVHAYDISHRSLTGFGLKEVAVHFGIAAKNRTYIPGDQISKTFSKDPEKVMRYVKDDVIETRELSNLLSRSAFVQTQMLPYSYQNACVRGNATKIDALMIREYLDKGYGLPLPDQQREFGGGYTDMFVEGVIKNVHHCDVRSLYPSLMLTRKIGPACDDLGVFHVMLSSLKAFRLSAKAKMQGARDNRERMHYDALQTTFKVLINSFYGYLGFSQGRFSDFDAADEVTTKGRALLKKMITWLENEGALPIEMDTDGIYFVPPEGADAGAPLEKLRKAFAESLPKGIEIEFDGEYESMYSYKMKNYALLTSDGEMIIKGAALKSRGLEPFQREFLGSVIRMKLEERDSEVMGLKDSYDKEIRERNWPIEKLAKTERLQDSPATYQAKRAKGKGSRRAAYELASRSERDYRAGDQVSYYVTGEKKSVAVHEAAKLLSEWNPRKRDENVPYYLSKLDTLYKKFGADSAQGTFDL